MSKKWEVIARYNGGTGGASVIVQSYLTPRELVELAAELVKVAGVHSVNEENLVQFRDKQPARVLVPLDSVELDCLRNYIPLVAVGKAVHTLRAKLLTAASLIGDVDDLFDRGGE